MVMGGQRTSRELGCAHERHQASPETSVGVLWAPGKASLWLSLGLALNNVRQILMICASDAFPDRLHCLMARSVRLLAAQKYTGVLDKQLGILK